MQSLQRLALELVKIEKEGRILQVVRRIVRSFQYRSEYRVIRAATHGVPRLHNQLVRIVLKLARTPGAFACTTRLGLQSVAHQARDFENQASVIGCEMQ